MYERKCCICWCNSQLWSPSPAGNRCRNMCHLCRDRPPPAPHSAWWLNVSTLWADTHKHDRSESWETSRIFNQAEKTINPHPISRSSEAPLWATHLLLSQNLFSFILFLDMTPPFHLLSSLFLLCFSSLPTSWILPAETVETLPQQDPLSRLQVHVADPTVHRLRVRQQVMSIHHH